MITSSVVHSVRPSRWKSLENSTELRQEHEVILTLLPIASSLICLKSPSWAQGLEAAVSQEAEPLTSKQLTGLFGGDSSLQLVQPGADSLAASHGCSWTEGAKEAPRREESVVGTGKGTCCSSRDPGRHWHLTRRDQLQGDSPPPGSPSALSRGAGRAGSLAGAARAWGSPRVAWLAHRKRSSMLMLPRTAPADLRRIAPVIAAAVHHGVAGSVDKAEAAGRPQPRGESPVCRGPGGKQSSANSLSILITFPCQETCSRFGKLPQEHPDALGGRLRQCGVAASAGSGAPVLALPWPCGSSPSQGLMCPLCERKALH